MKYVTMVLTSDAQVHRTLEDAKRYANKRYGEALAKLAHGLAQTDGKYSRITDYLDAHTEEFAALQELSKDCVPPSVPSDESEDE